MKLIQTEDYLLLIDEEAEIKEGNIAIHDFGMGYKLEIPCDEDNLKSNTRMLVVAYYPLTKDAQELDLPLLPNPFEEKVDIEILALKNLNKRNKNFDNIGRPDLKSNLDYENGYLDGAKFGVAQSHSKQFSLEDMKDALNQLADKAEYGIPNFARGEIITKIIQFLSTQKLPVSFEPEYDIVHTDHAPNGFEKFLKFKANSEGKRELVGTYKY